MNKAYTLLILLSSIASLPCFAQTDRPKQYNCLSAKSPIIIDGKLDDAAWSEAPWTDDFVDIEGKKKPKPLYQTKVKMLWDDEYFYVAAEMEEPHLWATYDQRDAVIFHENDFEVFIDPDGDTHQYYELEINALGTVWDLMLIKPYRDGGPAIDAWDIAGLKKGIHLNGTLNDPADTDRGWSVELAMPWGILEEAAKHGKKPVSGDTWRINFSRVNWRTENSNGTYTKQINPATGKSFPEFNWVWSAQGVIAMHQPETWGYVTFLDQSQKEPKRNYPSEPVILREIYYAQMAYFKKNRAFAQNLNELGYNNLAGNDVSIFCTPSLFEALMQTEGGVWHIDQDGRVWKTSNTNQQQN